jgi:hypothetical protein
VGYYCTADLRQRPSAGPVPEPPYARLERKVALRPLSFAAALTKSLKAATELLLPDDAVMALDGIAVIAATRV